MAFKAIPKVCLIGLGCIFTVLGIIGFILPLMPGFVFILAASFCFSRSSERFHHWLLTNNLFGALLTDYLAGAGIPRNAKIKAISFLWMSLIISCFIAAKWPVTLLLMIIGIGVSWYLVQLPEKEMSADK
ncbi:YbaN family protein [Algibacillus agarilyticus]|uniref:YbaN family protein n=1 Tax=Algibacillus agarilyticus TaxID=2234133 RepID=UPI000DCF8BFD|nr:YbaN family protein [Algibacillus agarilyticus]